ncbi:MAG: hypothetical protein AAGD28_00735 [Bacteroidota bacterium]
MTSISRSSGMSPQEQVLDQLKYRIKQSAILNNNFGYLFELFTYLSYPLRKRSTPKGKFVIFGTGRSGSTLLVNLLNSNTNIFCDNEIYHRKVMFPFLYLRFRSILGNKSVYGFKCLTYHLGLSLGLDTEEEKKEYLEKLVEKGYKIIYLRRHNIFRQGMSNLYARYKNQFHSNAQAGVRNKGKKMPVEISELKKWMGALDDQAQVEARLLENIPHLKISYEDDLAIPESHPETFQKLSGFLGINFEVPETQLRKVTPKSLDSFIENSDEVIQFLHDNGYESYLN